MSGRPPAPTASVALLSSWSKLASDSPSKHCPFRHVVPPAKAIACINRGTTSAPACLNSNTRGASNSHLLLLYQHYRSFLNVFQCSPSSPRYLDTVNLYRRILAVDLSCLLCREFCLVGSPPSSWTSVRPMLLQLVANDVKVNPRGVGEHCLERCSGQWCTDYMRKERLSFGLFITGLA